MRDHFAYLTADDEADFFQKVASAEAEASRKSLAPAPMIKTASVSAFEKISSQLPRDLMVLRNAGECGLNAGMMKRADAYMDILASRADITTEQLAEIFDKVAGDAIQIDLAAANEQLCSMLPPQLHHHVDDVLIKIGAELFELALLEKQAGFGEAIGKLLTRGGGGELGAGLSVAKGMVGRGASRIGRAVEEGGEAVGRGIGRAGRAVAEGGAAVGRGVAAPFKAVGRGIGKEVGAFRTARRAKIMEAPEKIQANIEAARAAGGPHGADAAAHFEKKLQKAKTRQNEMLGREAVKNVNRAGGMGKAPPHAPIGTPAAAENVAAKTVKAEGERGEAQNAATTAATPHSPPAEGAPAPAKGGAPTNAPAQSPAKAPKTEAEPPGGAEGKPAGFKDAWTRLHQVGWKELTSQEKSKLISGGVTAAAAFRMMTGHGAVTGGEGLV